MNAMGVKGGGAQPANQTGAKAVLPDWASGPEGVLAIFVAYACIHILLRLSASLNLPQDDVMAVLYSHTLQLGYVPRQPPLYDWLLWAVQQAAGPSLFSFLLLKYALLTATGFFIYLAGLRMFRDSGWAALAAFSLLLFYQIGWNIHEGVTHTATMICAIAATFWALIRLVETAGWCDYLVFGVCLGLGGLTKYGYAAFLVLLLALALLQPVMRAKILAPRMLASLAIAALIIIPFVLWIILNNHDLGAIYNETLSASETGRWRGGAYAVFLTLRRTLIFLSPLVVLVPLIFSGALAAMGHAIAGMLRPTAEPDWERIVVQIAFVALILMLLGVLFTGASNFRMRYMHPFYLLMPLWLVAMARRGQTRKWQPAAFVAASLFFALVVLCARAGYLYVGEKPFCSKCRQMTPYAELADAMREQGFKTGTIVAAYRHTAGNMRRLFPNARVVALKWPRVVPPIRPGDRSAQIALVWNVDSQGAALPKGAADEVRALDGDLVDGSPQSVRVPWAHLWRPTGYRSSHWNVVVIDLSRD